MIGWYVRRTANPRRKPSVVPMAPQRGAAIGQLPLHFKYQRIIIRAQNFDRFINFR